MTNVLTLTPGSCGAQLKPAAAQDREQRLGTANIARPEPAHGLYQENWRGAGSSISSSTPLYALADPFQLHELLRAFAQDDPVGVTRFLLSRQALVDILSGAQGAINEVFGDGTPVSLSLQEDIDGGGEPTLALHIEVSESRQSAREHLRHLDELWADAAMRDSLGQIVVGIRYIR